MHEVKHFRLFVSSDSFHSKAMRLLANCTIFALFTLRGVARLAEGSFSSLSSARMEHHIDGRVSEPRL